LAHATDPRVQAAIAVEAKKKEDIKQAKKNAKHSQYKEAEEKKAKLIEEAKQKEEEEKATKLKEAAEKKEAAKKYRLLVKEVMAYCCEKMPGTNYDKFYLEEMVKKYRAMAALEELYEKFKAIEVESVEDYVTAFLTIVDKAEIEKRQKKLDDAKQLEE